MNIRDKQAKRTSMLMKFIASIAAPPPLILIGVGASFQYGLPVGLMVVGALIWFDKFISLQRRAGR